MPRQYPVVKCKECNSLVPTNIYLPNKGDNGMCRPCWHELLRINRYLYGIPDDEEIARIQKVQEELKWKSMIYSKKSWLNHKKLL